jgi:2-amino-4-hydroxy-6-hydroxymethyldihydropteridine diphosphokinase
MAGYIALGSNVGEREEHLRAAVLGLAAGGLTLTGVSSIWETEPVGAAGPAWFLNMVVRVTGGAAPEQVLDLLLAIEGSRGRVRARPDAPRELDLDLLTWEGERRDTPSLTLPHPRLWGRRFVLAPLEELAPDLVDPATGMTVSQTLAALPEVPVARRLGKLALPETLPVYSRAL